MNRRKFLKFLGAGVAAGVAAPALLLKKEPAGEAGGWVSYRYRYTVLPAPDRTSRIRFLPEQHVPEQQARLGEYHTYYSVSDPEIAKSVKEYEASQCHQESIKRYKDYVDSLVSLSKAKRVTEAEAYKLYQECMRPQAHLFVFSKG